MRITHVLRILVAAAALLLPAAAHADRDDHRRGHGQDWHHDRGHGRGHWKHQDRHWEHRRHHVYHHRDYAPPVAHHTSIHRPPLHHGRLVNCTTYHNQFLGQIVGGVAGGLAGTGIGKGSGNKAAIIAGTIIGGALGGQALGYADEYCSEQVVAYGPVGVPVSWESPGTDYAYTVTPMRDYRTSGRYCREYQAVATVGGRRQETYGTACMQPDGAWEVVN